ncbi:MAG: glycosyltransferase family 2 protein, partial [Candidatus Eisenbacteria sp.]|nr:glycosyltransferase family 2 protein [Candidatus Eisenbacteria bacterium]
MLTASVGVMAYNEEQNIGKLLAALTGQSVQNVEIRQIIVVSSGSTDRTDDIVREWVAKDERISLIRQESREGKASAINLFLDAAEADIF